MIARCVVVTRADRGCVVWRPTRAVICLRRPSLALARRSRAPHRRHRGEVAQAQQGGRALAEPLRRSQGRHRQELRHQGAPFRPRDRLRHPRKVIKKASQKTIAKRSRLKAFTKVVNYNHIIPTRYTLDVDLKSAVTAEILESTASRVEARKGAKEVLEERFKTGKNRWFSPSFGSETSKATDLNVEFTILILMLPYEEFKSFQCFLTV